MDDVTGFVLAGGGFRGAFELGALRHLVEDLGIAPQVLTSASAGSILAMILAQGRTHDEFVSHLGDAERTLLAMTRTDLVFSQQDWLHELHDSDFAARVTAMITDRSSPGVPGPDPDPDADEARETDADSEQERSPAEADDRSGERRSGWPGLSALGDQVRAARRARRTLTATTSSVLTLDPFEAAIRGHAESAIPAVRTELIDRPGLELRMAVSAVHERETHYVRQDGHLVGPDGVTLQQPGSPPVGVIDGAIASCSVPMVFPARALGEETYVDGGCLQNIPLSAALELGAQRIFTLVAIPLHAEGRTRPTVPLWAAHELGFLQTQEENLAVELPEGATNTVIAPTLDVVGSFEVHRGLMQIDIDYGWMRAQETLADPDDGTAPIIHSATDSVIRQRTRAWHLEHRCLTEASMSPRRRAALTELKRCVRSAVQARFALGFDPPAGAAAWWSDWELHDTSAVDGFPTSFLDS